MAQTTSPTTHENPPHLERPAAYNFNVDKEGRNYGILLGVVVAVYLTIVNAATTELPLSLRFAKHLFIIPIVWHATKRYAEAIYAGNEVFKAEIGLLFRIGAWATLTLALGNIVLAAVNPDWAFEQFLNDNDTFGDAMMNSFFVAMETLVFVLIIGFVFMQYYKRGGSPED